MPRRRYVALTEGYLDDVHHAKTAYGVLRYGRDEVVAVVDGAFAGKRLAEVVHLNEADGPLFKVSNDPRITRVGRFLRSTSIDELPQLVNVLRNQMSMVGPRPALPHEVMRWDPELRSRLRVKPGITGMWQVNGRSDTSFEDYQRLDLYYVDNWSLLADLLIVLETIPVVLGRRGAR